MGPWHFLPGAWNLQPGAWNLPPEMVHLGQLRPQVLHAPGARMTVVKQTPSNSGLRFFDREVDSCFDFDRHMYLKLTSLFSHIHISLLSTCELTSNVSIQMAVFRHQRF